MILAWLHKDWPRIKKALRKHAVIGFLDETGWSFQDTIAATWGLRGKPPLLKRIGSQRGVLSSVIMLTTTGKILKYHVRGSLKSQDIIVALERFLHRINRPLIIVWDGASIHAARIVMDYIVQNDDIDVEFLPPYAPELNPEEACHGNVKQHRENFAPQTVEEMQALIDREFARLRRRPDLLLHFFQRSGLNVAQLK